MLQLKYTLSVSVLIASVMLSACSTTQEPRETILDDERRASEMAYYAPRSEIERQAYEEGVREVLIDMKGKMRARDRFTWDAPIIECGVQIPARVVNGMLIPSHEQCVQIAPGRWTEEAPTYLPILGGNGNE